MTAKDLALVARGMAPVVREYVAGTLAEREKALTLREQAYEARLAAAEQTITELRERVAAVETKAPAEEYYEQMAASFASAVQQKALDMGLYA
jgi:hypothetical protein